MASCVINTYHVYCWETLTTSDVWVSEQTTITISYERKGTYLTRTFVIRHDHEGYKAFTVQVQGTIRYMRQIMGLKIRTRNAKTWYFLEIQNVIILLAVVEIESTNTGMLML